MKKNTALIIGGVLILGVGAYFIIRSMGKKSKEPASLSLGDMEDLPAPVSAEEQKKSKKEENKQALIAAGLTLASLGIGEIVRRKQEKKGVKKTTLSGVA